MFTFTIGKVKLFSFKTMLKSSETFGRHLCDSEFHIEGMPMLNAFTRGQREFTFPKHNACNTIHAIAIQLTSNIVISNTDASTI